MIRWTSHPPGATSERTTPAKNGRSAATGRFTPGNPGRRKGSRNRSTGEIRAIARGLLEDPAYLDRFRERLIAGELPGSVEVMVWHFAFGRPTDRVEHSGALQYQRPPPDVTAQVLADIDRLADRIEAEEKREAEAKAKAPPKRKRRRRRGTAS